MIIKLNPCKEYWNVSREQDYCCDVLREIVEKRGIEDLYVNEDGIFLIIEVSRTTNVGEYIYSSRERRKLNFCPSCGEKITVGKKF